MLAASIGSLYDRAVVDTGRQPEFLFFVSFLVTFGFIRTSAHLIRAQVKWWPGNVSVGGTHIHHLVWGILLILIVGWVAIAFAPGSPWREILAVLFGVGTGLTLDEYALWLNLNDVYWSEKGRRSIDAVIIAGSISGIVLVGFHAWLDVGTDVADAIVAGAGALGLIAIVVALVNAAKEKFAMAALSILFWPLGLIGAVRLAKPHSIWAHFFYSEEERAHAAERYGDSPEKAPPAAGDAPAAPAVDRSAG